MAKGLTRRITRNEALSYERTSPNGGIGVTSIASVNGRRKGAKKKRGLPAPVKRAMKDCGTSLKAAWKKVKKGKAAPKGRAKPKPRARRNVSAAQQTPNYVRRYSATKAILRGHGRARRNPVEMGGWEGMASPAIAAHHAAEEKARKKAERADKAKERKMAKKPAKKKAAGKTAKRGARRRTAAGRTYGKYKPLTVRLGRKTHRTYMHATKRGAAHIPIYALHGFKSKAAMEKARQTDKGFERIQRRGGAISRMRERAAKRVMEHGDIFTPNTTVIPYSEWSRNMTPNAKKPRKKAKKKSGKLTAAELHAKRSRAAKKGARNRKAGKTTKRTKKKAAAAKKGTRRAAAKRKGKRSHASYVAAGKKAARTKKRNAAGKKSARKSTKRARRNPGAVAATPNRRRHSRRRHYADRRRHHRRHYAENRHRFRRNDYMAQLKSGLKAGAVVVAGFLAHKALSKVVSDQLLSRVAFFNGASVAPYKNLIAGVLVAAAGIPLAAKLVKDQTTLNQLAGGMAASLLHGAIVTVLTQMGQSQVTPYFAGYGDAMGGYGEYIATNGYGEYIATNGYGEYIAANGFGAFGGTYPATHRPQVYNGVGGPRYFQQYGGPVMQAAAGPFEQAMAGGYGAMMQAAAGINQAAAGYGLSQAAAGTGEYIASGAQGYGEYIATSGFGDMSATYDGIPGGDLSAAEHALNVAEAAAGLGFGDDTADGTTDVGVQTLVNPLNPVNAGSVGPGLQQLPIQTLDQGVPGLPGPKATIAASPASAVEDAMFSGRRGILAGGDGIFGGCNPMSANGNWQ